VTDNDNIYGKDCYIYIKSGDDWYLIGCGISCSFEADNEIILRTGINDGLFPKKRIRQTDWRGTVSGVMISMSDDERVSPFYMLEETIRRNENTYKFEYTDLAGVTKTLTGSALIKTETINADQTSFAKFDISLEGTGAFTVDDADSPTDVVDENVDSDYWTTVAGEYAISGNSVDGKSLTGKTILAVSREGVAHDPITSGTASGRQARFSTLAGSITFDSSIPFSSGETVWAMWKD
jgi:hypothetical protein